MIVVMGAKIIHIITLALFIVFSVFTNHVVAHQKMVLPSCHILESLSSPREDMDKRNN